MKKFASQLLLFFFLFSLLVLGIGKFDNATKCSNQNPNVQKLVSSRYFDSLDILFIGNSYCYSGINPAYFDSAGVRSLNLGLASAGLAFYRIVIDDYLATAKQKPHSVFICISPMIFSVKSDELMNNPVHRFLNHPLSNEYYILHYDPGKLKVYPKVAIRSFVRTLNGSLDLIRNKTDFCTPEKNPMYRSKGFIASSDTNSTKTALKTEHYFTPLKTDKFDKNKGATLAALAEALKEKGIEVVFFELPANKLYGYFDADYLQAYQALKAKLGSGYPLFSIEAQLNNSQYRDQDHLNSSGAALVSKELIQRLKSDKKLSGLLMQ